MKVIRNALTFDIPDMCMTGTDKVEIVHNAKLIINIHLDISPSKFNVSPSIFTIFSHVYLLLNDCKAKFSIQLLTYLDDTADLEVV